MGNIHEVFSVFSASPRRHFVLDLHLGCNLGSPCQTRCIEQHDSVLQFKWDLHAITKALEEISEWREDIYSSQASMLIKSVCDCKFIVTLLNLSDIISVMLPFLNIYKIRILRLTQLNAI